MENQNVLHCTNGKEYNRAAATVQCWIVTNTHSENVLAVCSVKMTKWFISWFTKRKSEDKIIGHQIAF